MSTNKRPNWLLQIEDQILDKIQENTKRLNDPAFGRDMSTNEYLHAQADLHAENKAYETSLAIISRITKGR